MISKKITALAVAVFAALPLAACSPEEEGRAYRVYMPDGAPAVALSALMDGGYDGASFTVTSAIAQRVSSGEADIAVMPVNSAATLYNGNVDIVMLTVNTHGNLYIVGEGEATFDDLVGKKLGSIGMGQVPDLTFKMIAAEKGISADSISVTYGKDAAAVLAQFQANPPIDYALIAEPAVTTAASKLGKKVVIDMQELWRETIGGDYPQACLVAKRSILIDAEGKKFIDRFIDDLTASDGWAELNPQKAVDTIAAHMESGTAASLKTLNAEIVKRCNIKTVSAADSKADCNAFFERLTKIKPNPDSSATALAKVPDDGFYYVR